jgi:predicted permease
MRFIDHILRETTLVFRSIRKSKGVAFTVVLTLGLGIGSLVSSFGFLNMLLLRKVGVTQPSELVVVGGLDRNGRKIQMPSTVLPRVREIGIFAGVCGFVTQQLTLELNGSPRPAATQAFSGDCFDTLGVKPVLGRLIALHDDSPGSERVALITFSVWQREFGGRLDVLGKVIRVEGVPFTIIGVTEREFEGLLLGFPPHILLPISQMPTYGTGELMAATRGYYPCWIIGRQFKNTSLPQTAARLREFWPDLLDSSIPTSYSTRQRDRFRSLSPLVADASTGMDYALRDHFRDPLYVLVGISFLILLICCVNAAGLFLLRGLSRQREAAVRLALGATRHQVAFAVVLEVIALAVVGSFIAVPLAYLVDQRFLPVINESFSNLDLSVVLDFRVLAFAFMVTLVAALLAAIVPYLKTSDLDLAGSLQGSGRTLSNADPAFRKVLITAQLSLTLVFVGAAGTFIQTVQKLNKLLDDIDPSTVWEFNLNPVAGGYRDLVPQPYYRDLLERIRSLPGIQRTALSSTPPLPEVRDSEPVGLKESSNAGNAVTADVSYISEAFFDTFRIALREGNDFSSVDDGARTPKAIVTRVLAHKLLPGGSALHRHLTIGTSPDTQDVEIVGIIPDVQLADLHASDASAVFLDYWQYPQMQFRPTLSARMSGSSSVLIDEITKEIRSRGREYPVTVRTLAQQRDVQLFQERALARLSIVLAAVVVVLVTLGLYGVLSYHVSSKAREISIRIAVGAKKSDLLWFVLREYLSLTIIGAISGLVLTIGFLRLISHFLYGVHPLNPLILIASLGSLLLTTAIATFVPCLRASATDPIVGLYVK